MFWSAARRPHVAVCGRFGRKTKMFKSGLPGLGVALSCLLLALAEWRIREGLGHLRRSTHVPALLPGLL